MITILVVEDEPAIRDMLDHRLTWEGFFVLLARHGAEAIEIALREQPNIILLDIGMPVMNGWQAAAHLKLDPLTAHIPIIALTGFAAEEDYQRSIEAGCDDYETKPVDFPRLLTKIYQLTQYSTTQPEQVPPSAPPPPQAPKKTKTKTKPANGSTQSGADPLNEREVGQ